MTHFYNDQLPDGLLARLVRALHRYRIGQEFESDSSPDFFFRPFFSHLHEGWTRNFRARVNARKFYSRK